MAANSLVFQYYLDNIFKFPKEIKNDIVYCQRSLKTHIKVHQMVIDVFEQEEDADPAQKQRILDEIESEIYEINAEQHFLFLRLRRIIDEFNKMVRKNNVPTDDDAIKAVISREVVPLVNDPNIEILPATVLHRHSEQKLIEKYFEVQKEKTIYEIEDSDDEKCVLLDDNEAKAIPTNTIVKEEFIIPNETIQMEDMSQIEDLGENVNSLSQMSLLKPISQRRVGPGGIVQGSYESYEDASKYLQMNLVEEKNEVDKTSNQTTRPLVKDSLNCIDTAASAANGETVEKQIDLPVSKNVKISRLNLRQALNKARTENMVAKAAANLLARSSTTSSTTSTAQSQTNNTTVNAHVTRKYDIRPRAAKSNAVIAISKERNAPDLNSSSEDSNPERLPSPPQPLLGFMEPEEQRTLPEHYGQEMFLRLFQLFTPVVLVQMQQRRSKRKRRNVHNNERADFHYGRIEYESHAPPEKKRKEFLLSPQVKRGLQTKRPKRNNVEKIEEIVLSRSSSSSPDEKRSCNECLKSGGSFEQCIDCKGYYHQLCHRDDDEKGNNTMKRVSVLQSKQKKLCPACKRSLPSVFNKDEIQYKNLHSTAQELQKKLVQEKDRRVNLQQESKKYKLQMRNLFNIVNTIKSDQENDSSG